MYKGAHVRVHPHCQGSWAKTEGIHNLFKAVITENLPKQQKEMYTQTQNDFRTPSSCDQRKINPGTS